jgi:hypothetical protein
MDQAVLLSASLSLARTAELMRPRSLLSVGWERDEGCARGMWVSSNGAKEGCVRGRFVKTLRDEVAETADGPAEELITAARYCKETMITSATVVLYVQSANLDNSGQQVEQTF